MAHSLPDYYRLLGVAEDAPEEEIRRRYRELARVYHPDVHPNREQAHEDFLLLAEAYQTLNDPIKRVSYDLALARARHVRQQASAPRSGRGPTAEELLVEAEARFFRREVEEAVTLCQQALRLGPRNAAVYALLGDIYTEMEQLDDAVVMYTYAVQYKPDSQLFARKLQQVLELEQARRRNKDRQSASSARATARRAGAPARPWRWTALAVGLAAGLLWWARQPADLLWWDRVPPRLLLAGIGVSFLAGFLLRRWRFLGAFESEYLLTGVQQPYGGLLPVGVLVSVVSLISFYLAVALYTLVALMEEHVSPSILKLFALTLLLAGLFAVLWLPLWKWILLFGGNLLLNGMVIGWMIGEIGMRPWD